MKLVHLGPRNKSNSKQSIIQNQKKLKYDKVGFQTPTKPSITQQANQFSTGDKTIASYKKQQEYLFILTPEKKQTSSIQISDHNQTQAKQKSILNTINNDNKPSIQSVVQNQKESVRPLRRILSIEQIKVIHQKNGNSRYRTSSKSEKGIGKKSQQKLKVSLKSNKKPLSLKQTNDKVPISETPSQNDKATKNNPTPNKYLSINPKQKPTTYHSVNMLMAKKFKKNINDKLPVNMLAIEQSIPERQSTGTVTVDMSNICLKPLQYLRQAKIASQQRNKLPQYQDIPFPAPPVSFQHQYHPSFQYSSNINSQLKI